MWPTPTLLVAGGGVLAEALTSIGALAGWEVRVVPDIAAARERVRGVRTGDAVVLLSHDLAVDGPLLLAALSGGAGYVGAVGSARTQEARVAWLRGCGLSAADLAVLYGPAGLDIASSTSYEIAVSIFAEILAVRTGSSATPLAGLRTAAAGAPEPPPRPGPRSSYGGQPGYRAGGPPPAPPAALLRSRSWNAVGGRSAAPADADPRTAAGRGVPTVGMSPVR